LSGGITTAAGVPFAVLSASTRQARHSPRRTTKPGATAVLGDPRLFAKQDPGLSPASLGGMLAKSKRPGPRPVSRTRSLACTRIVVNLHTRPPTTLTTCRLTPTAAPALRAAPPQDELHRANSDPAAMDCVVTTGAPRSVVGRLPRDRDSVRPCASLRTHRPAGAGRLVCGPLATADVPCRHHRRTPTMTKEPEPYLLERLVVCATRSPTSRPALSRLSDHGSELGGCLNPASNGRQAPATSFRAGDAEAERQFPGRGRLLPACPTDSPSRSPGCTGSTDSVTTIRSTTSTTWQP
jgi:hypothetical protein